MLVKILKSTAHFQLHWCTLWQCLLNVMCKKIAFFLLLFSFFKRRFTFVDCWTSLVPHVPVMVVRIHSKGFMLPAKHCACEERQRALASGWADKGTLRISLSHFSSHVGKHLGHGHIILGGVWSLGISRMLTEQPVFWWQISIPVCPSLCRWRENWIRESNKTNFGAAAHLSTSCNNKF